MLPENRIPTHPGEILLEEFLNPFGLSQAAFAAHIGVSVQRTQKYVVATSPNTEAHLHQK